MRGEAFLVVKAYEEYLHGPIIRAMGDVTAARQNNTNGSSAATIDAPTVPFKSDIARSIELPKEILLHAPGFLPHAETPSFPVVRIGNQFDFVAPGGISRWESEPGLKVCGFTVVTERGRTNKLVALRPAKVIISVLAERGGSYHCRYGIAIDNHLGAGVARIFSPPDQFEITQGEQRQVEIILNPVQIGPGDYTIGISILDNTPLEQLNTACRYDLLSRSFSISIEIPDSLSILGGAFIPSAEWRFEPTQDQCQCLDTNQRPR